MLLHIAQTVTSPSSHQSFSGSMYIVDTGLVLFVGLFVLFLWRYLCAWKCCGRWMQYANYCSILLALLLVIIVYDAYVFITIALSPHGKAAWAGMPSWLQPWTLMAPGFVLVNYLISCVQTFQHVERIREESAVHRHDRAVQIIILPALYSAMSFSALTRIYATLGSHKDPYSKANAESLGFSLARAETSFWVGDLYEAWALYQFGKLVLEVIKTGMQKQENSSSEQAAAGARGALASHDAVSSLAWLGLLSFLIVCVAQSAFSLWLLTFDTGITPETFNTSMNMFTLAGFLASCVAIYNVVIVETSFHSYLTGFSPVLKFITVKILVTFAFVQRTFFKGIEIFASLMPHDVQHWLKGIPFLGNFVDFEPNQFELFYASLILVECFVMCISHIWAWRADEGWYDEADEMSERQEDMEKSQAPLVSPRSAAASSYSTFLQRLGITANEKATGDSK